MKLDTPLVKVLMVGALLFCIAGPLVKSVEQPQATMSFTEAAQPLLAGRSDAQLNEAGDELCKMYKGGSSIDEVTAYLMARGASADSADQLARLALVYKCPDVLPKTSR